MYFVASSLKIHSGLRSAKSNVRASYMTYGEETQNQGRHKKSQTTSRNNKKHTQANPSKANKKEHTHKKQPQQQNKQNKQNKNTNKTKTISKLAPDHSKS